jgi:valine--pyruvate aminotransferase
VLFNVFAGSDATAGARRLLLPLAPEYIGYADLSVADGALTAHPASIDELGEVSSSTGSISKRLQCARRRRRNLRLAAHEPFGQRVDDVGAAASSMRSRENTQCR